MLIDGVDVGTITGSLGSEASTRAAADAALGSRIDGVEGVEGNLATEVSTRTSADTRINGRVDSLQSTLNAHTSSSNMSAHTFGNIAGQISDGQVPASFTRDSELPFSNIGGTLSDSQIPANITRDGEVTSFIDSRISTLTGDGTLATGAALAAEASTRSSADTTINGRINDLTTAISNETSTRAAAVSTLQSNIDTKVSKSGDTMTGNLSFNDSRCPDTDADLVAGPCLVDGVDVSQLNRQVQDLRRAPIVPTVAMAADVTIRDGNIHLNSAYNIMAAGIVRDERDPSHPQGQFFLTFETPLSNEHYVVTGSAEEQGPSEGMVLTVTEGSKTATRFGIRTVDASDNFRDVSFSVVVFQMP